VESHQWQKQYPRQKIKRAVWDIKNPTAKLKVGAAEPAGELLRPFRCRRGMSRGLQKRNRPGRKNSKHQRDTDEMGRMKERSPSALFPKNRDHDAIKEQKMNGTFGQPAQSKKNKRQRPNQPGRFFCSQKLSQKIIASA